MPSLSLCLLFRPLRLRRPSSPVAAQPTNSRGRPCRFLSVISLFNGAIPLIAIQMHALKVGEHLTLNFATVVDELTRGLVDEDEDAEAAPADRGDFGAEWLASIPKIGGDGLPMGVNRRRDSAVLRPL